jgi:hypothetical protein
MSECLTAAPLNPSDEDFIALDEVAVWIDQRGSKCVSDRINRQTLRCLTNPNACLLTI